MDEVAEVKGKTDIVAIIGEHVELRKAGRNFRGLCPFHSEKSPSFMVSPELQIYKCFGCGETGDVFTFLERYEGMEFYEALRFLAERAGVKLKPRSNRDTSIRIQILDANRLAASFYHYILIKHNLGKIGLSYLKEKRGIKQQTIEKFNLGFAPKNPELLFSTLTKKRKIPRDILEQSGLCFKTNRGYMDRFRERVIFPIYDIRGETVALAGRILPEYDTGRVGKYINSPETPVYHKSNSLYGMNITKDAIRKARTVILVEGELDMLSLWQAGIKNVVAIKGTALTEDHVRILSRFADTIIMALDSDFAGDTAAIRGFSFAQNAGLEIKVMKLGVYKDPDEFARADPDGVQKAIRTAVDAWEFVIDVVGKRFDLSTGAGKAKASRQLIPVLATIEDNIVRSHYLQKAATKFGVPVESVNREVMKQRPQKRKEENIVSRIEKKPKTRREMLEERLIVLYCNSPSLLEKKDEDLFIDPLILKIYKKLQQYLSENKIFEIATFSDSLPEELSSGFSDLMISSSADEILDASREAATVERELRELILKEKIIELTKKISDEESEGKDKKLVSLQEEFQRLSEKLSKVQEE